MIVQWMLVVPVKEAVFAKSRLNVPGVDHESFARAIALDTIAAAMECTAVRGVHVVTSDAITAAVLRRFPRVAVRADPGTGLTAAIVAGLADRTVNRAVLLGDLPALRPGDLSAALSQAEGLQRSFVPDADGTGTVLATARAGNEFPVLFGTDSAAAHRAAGFVDVDVPPHWGLRRDVDIASHLRSAGARGFGARTAGLLDRIRA